MKTLVSVITLTYKRFDLIYKAIDSVFLQDFSNIEYIISDDGSPNFDVYSDEISRYIETHKGDNITSVNVIHHENNIGTVQNINHAIKEAKGDIIMFVSADDSLFANDVITRIVNEYDKRKCDALVVGRALYDENGKFIRIIPSAKEKKVLDNLKSGRQQYSRLVTGRFFEAFSGCVLSYKKSFIENFGYYDERYRLLEDMPFFARYFLENHMECAFDIIALRYNVGGVSTGLTKHPQLLKDDELFRTTDVIDHINELSFIDKEIVRYENTRRKDININANRKAFFAHPIGFFAIKLYRFGLRLKRD